MSHQSDTTALRGAAEEGNLGLVLAQSLRELQSGIPGALAAGIAVVLDRVEVGAEAGIGLDDTTPSNLQERNERGAKVPAEKESKRVRQLSRVNKGRKNTYMMHLRAIESACSSTFLASQKFLSLCSSSGRMTMGTMSSSSQRREQSLGLMYLRVVGRPAPMNLEKFSCSYRSTSAIT